MIRWTGGTQVVERRPEDDPNLEFYHATSHFLGRQTYAGLHFGYLFLYHTDPRSQKLADGTRMSGTIDTGLMVSRDTIRWTRVDPNKRFFPLGKPGAWDGGMNLMMPEIAVGEELRFYYSSLQKEHSARENEGATGLATLRLDGFVSLEPKERRGTVTTKPFKLEGSELRINVNASEGSLRVSVLDSAGAPIRGYEADQCHPVTADSTDTPIRWRSHDWVAPLKGRLVRFRFHLQASQLYAFRVSPKPSNPDLKNGD